METLFAALALLLGAVGFAGFIANALRLNKLEPSLKQLEKRLEEPIEKAFDYRHAPEHGRPPKDYLGRPMLQEPAKSPTRMFVTHQGKLRNCPICDGLIAGAPTYCPGTCSDPACESTMAHLHQECGCGATWATYVKPVT